MKMSILGACALSVLLLSCAGASGGSSRPDLEIAGNWHMDSWNQDVDFGNGSLLFNDGANPGLSGDIVSYDNASKTLVMKWVNHPAYAGKYQKWVWSGSPASAMDVYGEYPDEASAAADGVVKYHDSLVPILFCDYFNRADTSSPSVGSAIWSVLYTPNAVSVSGDRLRMGTANAQQSQIGAAGKLDLSSDFDLSADFTNLRFGAQLKFANGHSLAFMPFEDGDYMVDYNAGTDSYVSATIIGGLAADTAHKLLLQKRGTAMTSKIYQGSSVLLTHSYTLPASEDYSQVSFLINGGGNSGFGTGDVYVDNVKILKR